jgi:hypothetical protein
MEHESDSEPENSTPDSPSNNIGPHSTEYRPNSRSENSTSLPLQSLKQHSVLEYYVLTRATAYWGGPNYVTYNTKSSRLRTFVIHVWPHILDLTLNALSEAGFFFTRKINTIF